MIKTVLVFAWCLPLAAQPAPTFETASIRLSPEGQCQGMLQPMTGGGLRVECVSLKTIVTWAYQVQNYQVSGGPGWIESVNWNILAKAAADGNPAIEFEKMSDEQRQQSSAWVRRRLQALLAERFQLVIRREPRDQPVYALTVAKNGPKLKESDNQGSAGMLRRGRGLLVSRGSVLPTVAQFLAIDLQRPVIDRTGLTAHYDFEIHWTNDDTGPSLFTVIQELGLKLEPSKGPVEMLVIERAERAEQ